MRSRGGVSTEGPGEPGKEKKLGKCGTIGSVRNLSELSSHELKLCPSVCVYPAMCSYSRPGVEKTESGIKPGGVEVVREVKVCTQER